MSEFEKLLKDAKQFIVRCEGVHRHAVDIKTPLGFVYPAERQYTGARVVYWLWPDVTKVSVVEHFVENTQGALDILASQYGNDGTDAALIERFATDVWKGLTPSEPGLVRGKFGGALRSSLHF